MIINGEIVYVSEPKEETGKGNNTYHKIEVIYKLDGDKTPRTQIIMSFVNPGVFKDIQDFDAGDPIWVERAKNAAGYWQWNKVSKEPLESEGNDSPAPKASKGREEKGGKVVGSNYETPQERGRKQVFIVRQSSFDRAMDSRGDLDPTKKTDLAKIFTLAENIEAWVFRGYKINPDDTIEKDV